jgi:hypothetical protein
VTLLWTPHLLATAGTPPNECFTSSGTYEDHVSGLPVFEMCFIFFMFASYLLLLIDWCIWLAHRTAAYFRERLSLR